MWGVTNPVSAPKSNPYWTTDLKKNLDTRSLAPSLLRILIIRIHTAHDFPRFKITVSQLSSAAEITPPRYRKEVTISRGRP